jgi:hypothetical protein
MEIKASYTGRKKRIVCVRIKMSDMNLFGQACSYIGELYIPDGKNRLTDLINNVNGKFIVLTNVHVSESRDARIVPFLLLNKDSIFSIEELDDEEQTERSRDRLHNLKNPVEYGSENGISP